MLFKALSRTRHLSDGHENNFVDLEKFKSIVLSSQNHFVSDWNYDIPQVISGNKLEILSRNAENRRKNEPPFPTPEHNNSRETRSFGPFRYSLSNDINKSFPGEISGLITIFRYFPPIFPGDFGVSLLRSRYQPSSSLRGELPA